MQDSTSTKPITVTSPLLPDLEEFIPKEYADIYHEKDQELFLAVKEQFYEGKVKCADGEIRSYQLYKSSFVVDEKIAIQIANQNLLPKGVNDWKSDFVWNAKYNKYVWEIISTTKENKNEENYRAEGEKIIIDATNAAVLSKDNWKIN